MKVLKSQYFACRPQGYVKVKEAEFQQSLSKKELSVSSRCNEILPMTEYKCQQGIQQEILQKNINIKLNLNSNSNSNSKTIEKGSNANFNYNSNLEKIIQKDQVYSINMDDSKSTNKKKVNSIRDLTHSNYTTINKSKEQMKRSMNFFQSSTAPSIQQNQNNNRLNQFYDQLITQKNHRKKLQEKYNILINFVQTNKKMKTEQSYMEEEQISENCKKNTSKILKKGKANKYDKYQTKLDTDQSQQAYNYHDNLMVIEPRNCETSRQSKKTNLQIQCQSCKMLKIDQSSYQVSSDFEQMKQKIDYLSDHISNLEQRIDQNDKKHQLQLLHRDLRQKQRQIQLMQHKNTRMKQTNDLMMIREFKSVKKQGTSTLQKVLGSNPIIISFFITLLILLLFSNSKSLIC